MITQNSVNIALVSITLRGSKLALLGYAPVWRIPYGILLSVTFTLLFLSYLQLVELRWRLTVGIPMDCNFWKYNFETCRPYRCLTSQSRVSIVGFVLAMLSNGVLFTCASLIIIFCFMRSCSPTRNSAVGSKSKAKRLRNMTFDRPRTIKELPPWRAPLAGRRLCRKLQDKGFLV